MAGMRGFFRFWGGMKQVIGLGLLYSRHGIHTRRLIEAATQIVSEAYEGKTTAAELLDKAEGKIFVIGQQRRDDGFTRIKEMLWPSMERIEQLQRSGSSITGVPSGFADLDEMTTGFQNSELIIVAARPSMGKTAFCLIPLFQSVSSSFFRPIVMPMVSCMSGIQCEG